MPRKIDINAALISATQRNHKGYLRLRMDYFAYKMQDQSDNRYWMLRNMGRIF